MTTMIANTADLRCPKCQGPMWDETKSKFYDPTKNKPVAKCKDKQCDGVIWPPRNGAAPARAVTPAPTVKQGYSSGGPLPGEEAAAGFTDALPHERLDHLFRVYSLVESHVLATSVDKFTKADVGTTPESVAAQIAAIFIQATKAGV